MRLPTHCRCGLRYLETMFSASAYARSGTLTDNEVNLRAEVELEVCMAHKVKHLDPFDDTHGRNTLARMHQFATPPGRDLGMKRTPITLCFFTSSALS